MKELSLPRKKAQEAPVKMLIPLVLLIFHTIFIVIFGHIVINFIKTGFWFISKNIGYKRAIADFDVL
ncbi:hypothetical protein AGMMS5026_06210 [Endomicrobiia bacterium]|nr:hypothetical protein AGMMS49523_09860 [Endomicrobiia bacterium]GHT13550.1 hypothetical protein AGMMS49571_07480 [Endomicrobiia bacterium]GHT18930.1 hypothetical protein AGMMS49929_01570 [Endomicrobiia bacterium]GHT28288.1 hypothetical protein AGMMS49995_08840 [Endomicrobiia bacterium]GHT30888.1 hypothetical protein AGMMS5026_06210 [Endomicrobiia bacterium]